MLKTGTDGFFVTWGMVMPKKAASMENLHVDYVALDELHAHPDNDYSQDATELAELMASIEHEGMGQLPLVRPLEDGGYQIVAGHRRVECYRRLNVKHPGEYAEIPVNVRDDLDDRTALLLLDTTNLMTRQLSPVERAKRYERIWALVPELRREDDSLRGVRTSQVIADIVTRETGQSVSRASIDRAISAGRRAKEVRELAERERENLTDFWYQQLRDVEGFTPDTVLALAARSEGAQKNLQADYQRDQLSPRQLERVLTASAGRTEADAERTLDAMIRMARELSAMQKKDGVAIDAYRLEHLKGILARI